MNLENTTRTPFRKHKVSRLVKPFAKLLTDSTRLRVVVFLRVSSREQKRSKSLTCQRRAILNFLNGKNAIVIDVFSAIASGWDEDRHDFIRAVECARKHGAVLLAESADRLLRGEFFKTTQNPPILPREDEWESLARLAEGVTLATLRNPDEHWKVTRGYQTRRGLDQRRAKCGRPRKWCTGELKNRRNEISFAVAFDHRVRKMTYREIAVKHNISPTTAHEWDKSYGSCSDSRKKVKAGPRLQSETSYF